jgi:hypothetical protein
MCKRKEFFVGKKGISVMVSYVLLIVFVIIIGAIVYQWLKTYVPAQALECPDGVSLFIKDADFDSSDSQLIITLRNNGRFDLAGYFIHATNSSDQELPIIDLSGYLNETLSQGIIFGNSVLFFEAGNNSFTPGSEESYFFDIPDSIGEPYSIRIIPTRFQEVDERERFVSCSGARVGQLVGEGGCIPDCTGRICGYDPVCGEICPPNDCGDGFFCDAAGKCIDLSCAPAPDPSLVGVCGTRVCGTATNGTCGEVNCLPGCDPSTETCNEITGQCESSCGDDICQEGEDCSCSDCEGQQAQCGENDICESGSCVLDISEVHSCPGYCVLLDYSTGYCTNSEGNCVSGGGNYSSGGDQWCGPGSQADLCCCIPT